MLSQFINREGFNPFQAIGVRHNNATREKKKKTFLATANPRYSGRQKFFLPRTGLKTVVVNSNRLAQSLLIPSEKTREPPVEEWKERESEHAREERGRKKNFLPQFTDIT